MALRRSELATPIGPMTLVHDANGLLWLAEFAVNAARVDAHLRRLGLGPTATDPVGVPAHLQSAFADYFAGNLVALEGLPTGVAGSPFERAVWAELRTIPPGETRTYGEIARALGGAASGPGPNARAVGTANGRNPLAIVVPCHRVIGTDGRLTGYAAGLDRKAWLLAHEGWGAAQPSLL